MKIGVLDIQGSVEEHFEALKKAGSEPVLVKDVATLDKVAGLIMPGGESTTIGKLLKRFKLAEPIRKKVLSGFPVWGTCAGAILLAKEIIGNQQSDSLRLADIAIERNAYGRQMDSFETEIVFDGKKIPAIFIRAPKISRVGKGVKILAKIYLAGSSTGAEIVAAREGNILLTTFHPELTDSVFVHRYFMKMC
jgi:5'-phosphate synthase pdxT subunit